MSIASIFVEYVTKVRKNFHISKIFRHSFLIFDLNLYLCTTIISIYYKN